jgi:uncharacterized protein YbcV (DUF1398 family)
MRNHTYIRIVLACLFAGTGLSGQCQTLKEKTMFTLEQIQAAHAKVKSGADFPAYAQELKKMGLGRYEFFLADGHAEYYGINGQQLIAGPKWDRRQIGAMSKKDFAAAVKRHQKGGSDFPTIALEAARYGVYKWIVDLVDMTCTYFGEDGKVIMVEEIPR